MSFVTQFLIKPAKSRLISLPSGSLTVNAHGSVMTSTLPQSVTSGDLREIGRWVLDAFRSAEEAGVIVKEFCFDFAKLKVVAREARGGAIVFFQPK